jgi:hypothetical protein
MATPSLTCTINFSTGASFGQAFIIGSGILGQDVLADSASVIVDVSDQVQTASITRGRNLLTDVFQAGIATVVIADEAGAFNPMNTASPYYGLLQPLRKIQIGAIDNNTGTAYTLYSGYITGYNYQQGQDTGVVSTTTLTAIDGFQLLNLATVSTVTGATAGETTGARITDILDTIGWPTSLRDVDTGQTTVQADPGTARTALAALQTVATTEYGALYMDATGAVTFQDRQLTSTSIGGTATDFSDTGAGIRYSNAQFVLNDAQIFNQANVTATGLAQQSYTDSASVALYFLHSYDITGLLMQTTTEADNYARAYVASRKDTSIRCDSITLNLYTPDYSAGIVAALGLDYFNPITVTQTQPGSSSITKTLQIFGVSHSITPNSWVTRFTTAEPIIDAFILDSSQYGVLDTSVLGY